jgi:hypothetical protein
MLISRRVSRRLETILLAALFIVVAAISYAERHHFHFRYLVAPLLVAFVFLLFRNGQRLAAAVAIVLILAAASPTTHFVIVGMIRRAHGPIERGWTEVADPPRARGAYFTTGDAALVAAVKKYIDGHLAPNETFFDFTNRGILYFLFNRDCPIREEEVAYYEPEGRQRAVIAALERNPHVKAALVPKPGDGTGVDNVSNDVRAPLVWEYVRTHFHADFEEGNVVFWRRNE